MAKYYSGKYYSNNFGNNMTKIDCLKIIGICIWTVIITWVTFFTRFYDGFEYFLVMVITWVCVSTIMCVIPVRKKDE